MKIKAWELRVIWDNDSVDDVSILAPRGVCQTIEGFCDYLESEQETEEPEE
jgi:hypothetical protein